MNRMPSAEPGLSGITAVACILGMAGLGVLAGHDLGYGNTARFLVVFFVLPVIIAAIVDFRLGLLVCLISNLLHNLIPQAYRIVELRGVNIQTLVVTFVLLGCLISWRRLSRLRKPLKTNQTFVWWMAFLAYQLICAIITSLVFFDIWNIFSAIKQMLVQYVPYFILCFVVLPAMWRRRYIICLISVGMVLSAWDAYDYSQRFQFAAAERFMFVHSTKASLTMAILGGGVGVTLLYEARLVRHWILAIVLLMTMGAIVGVSSNRGLYVASIIQLMVILIVVARVDARSVGLFTGFLIAGAVAFSLVGDRVIARSAFTFVDDSGQLVLDSSSTLRLFLMNVHWNAFLDFPFWQKLFGYFTHSSEDVTREFVGFGLASHNAFITVIIEWGLVGFVLWCGSNYHALRLAFRIWKTTDDTFTKLVATSALGMMLGNLFHYLVHGGIMIEATLLVILEVMRQQVMAENRSTDGSAGGGSGP